MTALLTLLIYFYFGVIIPFRCRNSQHICECTALLWCVCYSWHPS